jgi:glycosyltransferase involved in cell wall biosynthesis
MTQLSVLIPTRNSAVALGALLSSLSRQTLDASRFEVLVGIDGPETGELSSVGSAPKNMVLMSFQKAGPSLTRNRLLEAAKSPYVLLLDEHMRAEPTLLEQHLAVQLQLAKSGQQAAVVGAVPWKVRQPDRIVDVLMRRGVLMHPSTPITGERLGDSAYDWTFRCAWSANMSMPAEVIRSVAGWSKQLSHGLYDDSELVYRINRFKPLPVYHWPDAKAWRDRRVDAMDAIRFEALRGYEAYNAAVISPQFVYDLLGRELTSSNEAVYSRGFLNRERSPAEQALWSYLNLAPVPVASMDDGMLMHRVDRLIASLEILKGWFWRRGHMAAVNNESLSTLDEALDEFVTTTVKRWGKGGDVKAA